MNDILNQLKNGSVLQGCQDGNCEKSNDDDVRELSATEIEAISGGRAVHSSVRN